jgi:hypothetical protein
MYYLIALVLFVSSLFGSSVAHADAPSQAPASQPIVAPVSASLPTYLTEVSTSPAPTSQVEIPAIPAPEVGVPQQPAQRCEEDMPCWDCATMGNKICGPVAEPVAPERCEEDMPCWDCSTMGNLQCGPSQDMEADAFASFDSQTGMVVVEQEMKLSYEASVPVEPTNLEVGSFAIPSSNIPNIWHIMRWDVLTTA